MNDCNVSRRDILRHALSGLALPTAAVMGGTVGAHAQTAPPEGAAVQAAFSAADVDARARTLAAAAYDPPKPVPLGELANAPPEAAAAIRCRPEEWIWVRDDLGYVIEPLHRNWKQPGEVELHIVEGGAESRLAYDPGKFDFGKLSPPPASARLGFTGFLVHQRDSDGQLRPVASFYNAAVLSAIARNQEWGAISRLLTVRSTDQKAEVPLIRAIWIEKPSPPASALVMHALVDTPSLTGAFHFTLRAENAILIDTECTIFSRRDIEHFGLTPIYATHLVGPLGPRVEDDVRPAVYEVSGVQMLSGRGEWIWRPVTNRERLQSSAFVDRDPKGFGLIQRDRSFKSFLDDENAWQRRPSVWVEPIGSWGPGEVTLLEIPAAAASNKNIACYWRPRFRLTSGSETQFAYRQFWSWRPPERPGVAIVTRSRMGRSPGATSQQRRRFLVQFTGSQLTDPAKVATVVPNLWASAGKIASIRTYRAPQDGEVRVVFDLALNGEQLVELRLVLEQEGRSISETWLYRWTT